MRKLLAFLVLASLATGLGVAFAYENDSVVGQVPNRIIVVLKPGFRLAPEKAGGVAKVGLAGFDALSERFTVSDIEGLYAGMTGKLAGKVADKSSLDELDRTYTVDFDGRTPLSDVKRAYESLPEVEKVWLVDICKSYSAYLPNDGGLNGAQWYLRNMADHGKDIRAIGGWNESLGDSNIVVCVLDSGVDWQHPDLGGNHPDKVNGAIWTNWDEYYGTAGVDDDANGKIDDIRGWDFVHIIDDAGYPGEDMLTADNDPMDFEGHGTMCAGTIGAVTNNGVGIAGAAPGVKIMPVRCGYLPEAATGGVVRMDFVAAGMVYAAANGAKIINCSWGSSSYIASATTTALNAGVIIITAAGNDNLDSPSYLGSRANVLSVAATTSTDQKASFSNFGTWVELAAPGVGIYSTAYDGGTNTHYYASWDGTSFSSPITCGATALIWSAHPGWTAAQIRTLLLASCDNIDALNPGFEGRLGAGRPNLLRALGDNVHKYPLEFPTLFDAMNSAAVGDTIKILGSQPLSGPVTLLGDGLKIMGGYDASYTTRDLGAGRTVISGGGSPLRFSGPMGTSTVVDGFIVTGGDGQTMNVVAPNTRGAGGVLVNLVSPTLRNLKVYGNTVGGASQLGCGGGVLLTGSSAVLENCEITGNSGIYGAGVFATGGAPTLTNCTITGNTVLTNNGTYPPRGGGVYASDTNLHLNNCTISGHQNTDLGGGVYGGGQTVMSTVTISGCTIAGNTAKTGGGGLYQTGGSLNVSSTLIENNGKTVTSSFMYGGGVQATGGVTATLSGVTCRGSQAQAGGGFALTGCGTSTVSGCVLNNNTGQFWGGGLLVDSSPGITITGNTIYGNNGGGGGGGGMHVTNGAATVTKNISAGNLGGVSFGNGFSFMSAAVTASCNDAFGNQGSAWTGIADPTGTNGNIAADPRFCDAATGNFQLQGTSPCRPGNSGACGQIGALLGACYVSPVPGDDVVVPAAFRVEQNFPNPFNPKTTIRFALPAAAHTTVSVFDLAGHHVRTLLDGNLEAQMHEVVWAGDDARGQPVAAGVYFYEVVSGSHRAVGRMALVK